MISLVNGKFKLIFFGVLTTAGQNTLSWLLSCLSEYTTEKELEAQHVDVIDEKNVELMINSYR